jgi:hypothetical protein
MKTLALIDVSSEDGLTEAIASFDVNDEMNDNDVEDLITKKFLESEKFRNRVSQHFSMLIDDEDVTSLEKMDTRGQDNVFTIVVGDVNYEEMVFINALLIEKF